MEASFRSRRAVQSQSPHAHGSDPAYAEWQLGRFTAVVDELEARGIAVPVRLFAASPFVIGANQNPSLCAEVLPPHRNIVLTQGGKQEICHRRIFT